MFIDPHVLAQLSLAGKVVGAGATAVGLIRWMWKVWTMTENVDKILTNHLPHQDEKIDKLGTKIDGLATAFQSHLIQVAKGKE